LHRKGTLRVLGAVAVLALVAAACSNNNNGSSSGGGSKKTVKLAFFGALTGSAAGLVTAGWKAVQLAVDDANAGKYGNLPVTIEAVPEDTTGDPTVIPPLATKVANDPSFVGVIGPNFSGESQAGGPTFDKAGIPFVTGSATNPTLNANHWTHWFRAQANDNTQAPDMASYIAKVLKPNCAFVLSDDTTYGKGLAQIGQSTLKSDGVKVTSDLGAVPNGGTGQTKDFSPYITKAKQSGCTAMFYGGYSPEAGPLRAQMNQQGLTNMTMVLGDGGRDSTFLTAAGAAGNGTIASCPCGDLTKSSDPAAKSFLSEYKAKYGTTDTTPYGPDYWDIAQMYINAFKAGKTTRADITAYFQSYNQQGISKHIQFQSNGELNAADAKIYMWKDVNKQWSYLGLSTDVIPA
jgi:branched-chain amino acid transport system substrate-binding protein